MLAGFPVPNITHQHDFNVLAQFTVCILPFFTSHWTYVMIANLLPLCLNLSPNLLNLRYKVTRILRRCRWAPFGQILCFNANKIALVSCIAAFSTWSDITINFLLTFQCTPC